MELPCHSLRAVGPRIYAKIKIGSDAPARDHTCLAAAKREAFSFQPPRPGGFFFSVS